MAAPNPTKSLAAAAGGGAVTAPRWIPKRGQVLRNVLKMCFPCLCSQGGNGAVVTNLYNYVGLDLGQVRRVKEVIPIC
ncbi:hypothetical protein RHMOL_Rhmol09G0119800 [Rhododendron molle]|uniref:Uncharacterized protein n=1 Tax=Rhododendron molle TaxID=49168 RepID=A0ACC0MDG8_RHOML|nr:hypothetical protein RHMOL_Rhmol09G0119800 [Rhododendron molle]